MTSSFQPFYETPTLENARNRQLKLQKKGWPNSISPEKVTFLIWNFAPEPRVGKSWRGRDINSKECLHCSISRLFAVSVSFCPTLRVLLKRHVSTKAAARQKVSDNFSSPHCACKYNTDWRLSVSCWVLVKSEEGQACQGRHKTRSLSFRANSLVFLYNLASPITWLCSSTFKMSNTRNLI